MKPETTWAGVRVLGTRALTDNEARALADALSECEERLDEALEEVAPGEFRCKTFLERMAG